jgi:NADPH:quinone reductase-like Zn-dependent oxidoreductase
MFTHVCAKDQPLPIYRTHDKPLPVTLEPNDVVIKIHAVSLNCCDIAMLTSTYPVPLGDKSIPCSDAAAEVVAIEMSVSRFNAGDRVCPITGIGKVVEKDADDGVSLAIGASCAGVLQEYAIFEEQHLVKFPKHLSWKEVSFSPVSQGDLVWMV